MKQVGGTHYTDMAIEPWNVIDTWPMDQRIGAYRAGVLKYLMRAGSKGDAMEDYRKAMHYCEKLVETVGKPAPAKLDQDGWIEWGGGECPVAPNAIVSLKHRFGGVSMYCKPAQAFYWKHLNSAADVIAYKVSSE